MEYINVAYKGANYMVVPGSGTVRQSRECIRLCIPASPGGTRLKKLVNRNYIDVSDPGIAYQLAHGRGQEPRPMVFEGLIRPPHAKARKASRFAWGFNHE